MSKDQDIASLEQFLKTASAPEVLQFIDGLIAKRPELREKLQALLQEKKMP